MADETLYSDDLLPMDSSMLNLDPPEEQALDEQHQRSEILAAAPVIDSILEWFDEQIDQCDRLDGLDLESPIDLKVQVMARQLLKSQLLNAKNSLEVKRDTFLPQYKH